MSTIQQLDVALLRLQVEIALRGLAAQAPARVQITRWYQLLLTTLAEEGHKVSEVQARNPYTTWH